MASAGGELITVEEIGFCQHCNQLSRGIETLCRVMFFCSRKATIHHTYKTVDSHLFQMVLQISRTYIFE